MTYRAEIDGLRAIAIISVLLFHVGTPGFTGGFVGVDIFFVISGFLITSILLKDLEAARFSILEFYHRRARRIFPALFVVLLTTSAAASMILMPKDLEEFGRTLLGATFFSSNFVFLNAAGYFTGPSDLKPLLHTWSLSVEEQFYIVFPALLWFTRDWSQRLRLFAFASLGAVSLAFCIHQTKHHHEAAFFLAPYRAWEFLIGAALTQVTAARLPRWLSEGAAWAGLAAILAAVFAFTPEMHFPGYAAALPCIGAALIIFCGERSRVQFLLASRPAVFIGLISYSLYLWHWPILALLRYQASEPPTPIQIAGALTLASILAVLSWRYVEQPFRRRQWMQTRRTVFSSFGIGAVALAAGALAIAVTGGWPQRLSPRAQKLAAMYDAPRYYSIYDRGGCFLDYNQKAADYDLTRCLGGVGGNTENSVLIFGDSFAAHYYPGLRETLNGRPVHEYAATSCRPIDTGNKRCRDIYQAFFDRVLPASKASMVIVSGFWVTYEQRLGAKKFSALLTSTLKRIRAVGRDVTLVGQSPTFYHPVPYELAERPETERLMLARQDRSIVDMAAIATAAGARYFDPSAKRCDGRICVAAVDGHPFHWDFGHMTMAGSKAAAAEMVKTFEKGDSIASSLQAEQPSQNDR